jgi:hypothetical protein
VKSLESKKSIESKTSVRMKSSKTYNSEPVVYVKLNFHRYFVTIIVSFGVEERTGIECRDINLIEKQIPSHERSH